MDELVAKEVTWSCPVAEGAGEMWGWERGGGQTQCCVL